MRVECDAALATAALSRGGPEMKFKLIALLVLLPSYVGEAAAVTFYTTQSGFEGAASTILIDDFSWAGAGFGGHGVGSITSNGVTYTDVSGGHPDLDLVIEPPGLTNVGANVGVTTDFLFTTDYDEHIRATFSRKYRAVGFTAYFNGLGPGALTVFGEGGSTIGMLDFADGMDPATHLADRGYLGFTTQQPVITGFQWDSQSDPYQELNTGFSNLSAFPPNGAGPFSVPGPVVGAGLPGLIVMFGLLLSWMRRRRECASRASRTRSVLSSSAS